MKAEAIEVDLAFEEAAASKTKTPTVRPVITETFDLEDDDEEEDAMEMQRATSNVEGFADENEALDETDNWGDAEKIWQRSRSGSLDGSTWAEEYGEETAEGFERSGDSDEDILEVRIVASAVTRCHQCIDRLTPRNTAHGERRGCL